MGDLVLLLKHKRVLFQSLVVISSITLQRVAQECVLGGWADSAVKDLQQVGKAFSVEFKKRKRKARLKWNWKFSWGGVNKSHLKWLATSCVKTVGHVFEENTFCKSEAQPTGFRNRHFVKMTILPMTNPVMEVQVCYVETQTYQFQWWRLCRFLV